MKPGYYWIKSKGEILPARWDGEKWHHEKGNHFDDHVRDESGTPVAIHYSCPTGCTCKPNEDGSITVTCH